MRTLILSIALTFFGWGLSAVTPVGKVDKRIELLSIVFRLAGTPEYTNNNIVAYADRIDRYFEKYKGHPAIVYAAELVNEQGIRSGLPMWFAVYTVIDENGVSLTPAVDILQNDKINEYFTKENTGKLIRLLDDFYRDTDFRSFFESNRDLYSAAEHNMNSMISKELDDTWFESFFGQPLPPSTVYIAMDNGPNNYALFFCEELGSGFDVVLGAHRQDEEGMPVFGSTHLSVLVHEFGHHFVNPVFDKYWPQIEAAADAIYPYVQNAMYKIGYGSANVVMCEWLNNLCVMMYFKEKHPEYFYSSLSTDMYKGFVWLERGVNFMDNFYSSRDIYPYFEDFMPQITAFLGFTADNFDKVWFEFENRAPYAVNVFPAPGSNLLDIGGDATIRITFSEPMSTFAHGVKEPSDQYVILPVSEGAWADDRTLVLTYDRSRLEKGRKYALRLHRYFTLSLRYYPIIEDYEIPYNTGE